MHLREILLTESNETAWIYQRLWPAFVNAMLEECYKLTKEYTVEFIQVSSPVPKRYSKLQKNVSTVMSRVVQKHIEDLYGPKIKYEGKRIKSTSIRVKVIIGEDDEKGGYHQSYNDTAIILKPKGIEAVIRKLAYNLNDEDVDFKQEFELDIARELGAIETLTHEITHLLQSIRASTRTKKGLHGKSLITNIGPRGEYEGKATGDITQRMKYIGFPLELEAYAAAAATALVRSATRHIRREKDPQAWNRAIDSALDTLKHPNEAIKISSNFGLIFNNIKRAIETNNKVPNTFKTKEIARIWKRFLKMTYIQVMSHKEKI